MTRSVRRRVEAAEGGVLPNGADNLALGEDGLINWTRLPSDIVLQIFSSLSHRDQASLSSTCRTLRVMGKSSCLWEVLDMRPHKFDAANSSVLASRCENLKKLRYRGNECTEAFLNLQAKNLVEISAEGCKKMTDAALCVLAARHRELQCLQIGLDFCERITTDALVEVAVCCQKLQKLRLSVHQVDAYAINALAKYCPSLVEIGFIDCRDVDEAALGNVESLRFLSVSGTANINWDLAVQRWRKMPNLVGLDVSRTDILPIHVSQFLSPSSCLKVICALNCPSVETNASSMSRFRQGKVLLAVFTDCLKELADLFVDVPEDGNKAFLRWKNSKMDEKLGGVIDWLEWNIVSTLLRVSELTNADLDDFWVNQGTTLLVNIIQSAQEEVQERASATLANFVVVDDENVSIDVGRAEAVMRNGGIRHLLKLAQSPHEGLQSEAVKAVANLSVNAKVAKVVASAGGIRTFADLARSFNKLVAEEAAGGLWNLSVGEEYKGAIAEVGGIKVLVDLISKWSRSPGGDGALERAAGALANLAADDKCSVEVASEGGIHALVMLVCNCRAEGVQEQAARGLANLAAHGDSNNNNNAIGKEAGALEALLRLIRSPNEGVKQEAVGALWNLSFDDQNREAIVAAGGVQALVALARSCLVATRSLQERAAGALWGLSVSEANSIEIGRAGGVIPLIALTRSNAEEVHETAAGALWNLAFNPRNALRIVEGDGVMALVTLCASSKSKMARFMSTLALAYMFDGRMNKFAPAGSPSGGGASTSKSGSLNGLRRQALKRIDSFLMSFYESPTFSNANSSPTPAVLTRVVELVRIQEAGHLRCSGAEIGRFVGMLKNRSPTLKSCATFALLQFSIPGCRHAVHHVNLLRDAGAPEVLRLVVAGASTPLEARVFARTVLQNLEQEQAA